MMNAGLMPIFQHVFLFPSVVTLVRPLGMLKDQRRRDRPLGLLMIRIRQDKGRQEEKDGGSRG